VSCKKNGISPFQAIKMLLENQTPSFIETRLNKAISKAA
jgi:hypothetical protein